MDKKGILNEFVALTGYHRKHVVRLLRPAASCTESQGVGEGGVGNRRVYDEAVKEALIVIWEASDRMCGKRVKAILPEFLEAMERHGHLRLDAEVRRRVLQASGTRSRDAAKKYF
jgi:hypothetical protein